MGSLSQAFFLLQEDGFRMSNYLTSGFRGVRSSPISEKEGHHLALKSIAMGLGKLTRSIVVIDHMLDHNLHLPDEEDAHGEYEQDLRNFYDACVSLGNTYGIPQKPRTELDEIDQQILLLMSDLTPVLAWYESWVGVPEQRLEVEVARWSRILLGVLENDLSASQKKRLNLHDDLSGVVLETKEVYDYASRYAVLRVALLVDSLRDLVRVVSNRGYTLGLEAPAFPLMQEFLEWLPPDRRYILRKKQWP